MTESKIPLYGRGGVVVATAIVDDDDRPLVEAYRWNRSPTGYARTMVRLPDEAPPRRQRELLMHRLILGLTWGDRANTDHINRDRLDNRRSNLRIATTAENAQNQPGRDRTSAHRGVCWNRAVGRWQAQVRVAGKAHYLGLFEDEREAARAASAFREGRMPFSQEEASA